MKFCSELSNIVFIASTIGINHELWFGGGGGAWTPKEIRGAASIWNSRPPPPILNPEYAPVCVLNVRMYDSSMHILKFQNIQHLFSRKKDPPSPFADKTAIFFILLTPSLRVMKCKHDVKIIFLSFKRNGSLYIYPRLHIVVNEEKYVV